MYALDSEINELQGKLLATMNRVNELETQKVEIDANRKHILENQNEDNLALRIASMKETLQDALSEYNDRVQRYQQVKKEKEELEKISELLIKGLSKRLEDRNITIKLTKKAMAKIVEDGSIKEYGARPLKRSIQKNIEDLLSEELLRNPELSGIINIDYKNDKFVVKKTKR